MSINLAVSFLAGVVTFFSPCILPVIPGYFAILTSGKGTLLRRTILFVLGLALSFTVLGALVGWIGAAVVPLRDDLVKILGLILVIFGVNLIKPLPLPMLQRDWQARISGSSDWSALALGGAFGVAWTPCSGVILGAIIAQALLAQTSAIGLLLAYSVGLVLPMIVLAAIFQRTGRVIRLPSWINRYYASVLGVILIIFGLSLIFGWIDSWRGWLLSVNPDWEKSLLPLTR